MNAVPRQRIAQLAPLADVYAVLERIARPVAPRQVDVDAAAGRILAADALANASGPAMPTALRDGWAVASDLLADAGPYAPVALAAGVSWVDQGATLPPGCDAVLPPDALLVQGASCEAIASIAPGEGVLPAGFDHAAGAVLLRAGRRLRELDCAVLRAAGVARVAVRVPRVVVVCALPMDAADAVTPLLAHDVTAAGATIACVRAAELAALLRSAVADAIITIGGNGEGRNDRTAQAIAAAGELVLHGMGIRPGETAGLGIVASRPVLMLPGRLDAALAGWLLVGRRMLRMVTGETAPATPARAALTRKIASSPGVAEVVLVVQECEGARPLAGGTYPLHALAAANGWVLVPPESEGYPVGATVDIHPLT